mgnify:CR=1 FL=1
MHLRRFDTKHRQIVTILIRVLAFVLTLFVLTTLCLESSHAQYRSSSIRDIKPRRVSLRFERFIVRDTDEGLEIDYEIERNTWNRFEKDEIDLWFEVWVPMEVEYRFHAFNYFRAVWPVSERDAVLEFPPWVVVNRNDRVAVCPLAGGPGDHPGSGKGWICDDTEWFRPRSDWSVQLSAGLTFDLLREDEPLRLLELYWLAPYGPFFVPGFYPGAIWGRLPPPMVRPR